MRFTLHHRWLPTWAFVEVGLWPFNRGHARFLLCIGEWVHLGFCGGKWWLDNLQRRPTTTREEWDRPRRQNEWSEEAEGDLAPDYWED